MRTDALAGALERQKAAGTRVCRGVSGRAPHLALDGAFDNGMGGAFKTCLECRLRDMRHPHNRSLVQLRASMHTPCARCGDRRLLHGEFAHVQRADKRVSVADTRTAAAARAELKRCRTLCHECHAKETASEAPRQRPWKASELTARSFVLDELATKFGGRCQFTTVANNGAAVQPCAFGVHANTPAWRARLLEWDHQPGCGPKQAHVSELVRNGALAALRVELAKCVPLCRAHHRLVTLYRRRVDVHYNARAPMPTHWAALGDAELQADGTLPDAFVQLLC